MTERVVQHPILNTNRQGVNQNTIMSKGLDVSRIIKYQSIKSPTSPKPITSKRFGVIQSMSKPIGSIKANPKPLPIQSIPKRVTSNVLFHKAGKDALNNYIRVPTAAFVPENSEMIAPSEEPAIFIDHELVIDLVNYTFNNQSVNSITLLDIIDVPTICTQHQYNEVLHIYKNNQKYYIYNIGGEFIDSFKRDITRLEHWFCNIIEPKPSVKSEVIKWISREQHKLNHGYSIHCNQMMIIHIEPLALWKRDRLYGILHNM